MSSSRPRRRERRRQRKEKLLERERTEGSESLCLIRRGCVSRLPGVVLRSKGGRMSRLVLFPRYVGVCLFVSFFPAE